MVKVIDVIIDEDGKIKVDTSGFIGAFCVDESDKLLATLKELGVEIEITSDVRKPEFYAKAKERIKVA